MSSALTITLLLLRLYVLPSSFTVVRTPSLKKLRKAFKRLLFSLFFGGRKTKACLCAMSTSWRTENATLVMWSHVKRLFLYTGRWQHIRSRRGVLEASSIALQLLLHVPRINAVVSPGNSPNSIRIVRPCMLFSAPVTLYRELVEGVRRTHSLSASACRWPNCALFGQQRTTRLLQTS